MNQQVNLSEFGTITLGSLIDILESVEKPLHLGFDFGGLYPLGCDSYRGYYDHLAVGFTDAPRPDHKTHFKSFLKNLKNAVGETFSGWKGGEFTMDRSTPVWVAERGIASGTAIVDVVVEQTSQGGFVRLITKHVD